MALTPDDVVTKQFQHVRFKDGFDPDEVDDFLDEIVIEWRKALEENAELKAKLAAYESGEKAPAAAETPAPAPVAAPAPTPEPSSGAAPAGIIELAQRLHDEHVAEGKSQRDQLIADAKAQAAKILADAEAQQREQTARLERERNVLESRITELHDFERSYRSQLRSYIENQLRDLDSQSGPSGSSDSPVSQAGR
ncbi:MULTISPECIES: DivIVA domain-containing protein [Microbacterium]|uniref:Cell wall synthesis protein Wag31 n=1 Tax=Microbacterium resistens TaxID=156977 RepID=A0ABY3RW11_9MICO|nr:DivIVA domain-containing protein [Microbacterium resistens]MBW1637622.1 DivIVA domain-containing protein [Microbacterium resistens]MDA4895219.1 DivIVA domain-containing protein [Streptomyces sp. MS2A]UGS27105.1 DivIVA domain-containing protein [Microbacterium resistens]